LTVLSGVWSLVNGGEAPVGTEKWRLEETSEEIRWNSTIDKKVPFPHKEELSLTAVPRKWRIKSIRISSVGEGRSEAFEGTVDGGRFGFAVSRDGNVEQYSIPVSESTEFDYLSLVFNTVTFHRLRLRRGESREIEVAYIFPVSLQDSFRTRMVRQSYQRLRDEPVDVPAGHFHSAKHYVYRNLDSGWTSSVWTDNLETVLRYEKLCELLSYNRSET
jgi:hypothetical protein